MEKRLEAVISGRVQGIGYRAFVEIKAIALGLRGYVKNLADGSVEVVAEGEEAMLEKLLDALENGNPLAKVQGIRRNWSGSKGGYRGFVIRH